MPFVGCTYYHSCLSLSCSLFLPLTHLLHCVWKSGEQPGKVKLENLSTHPNLLQRMCRDKSLLMTVVVREGVSWGKRFLFDFWEQLILCISRGRGIFIMVLDFLLDILCSYQVRWVIWNLLFFPQSLQIA